MSVMSLHSALRTCNLDDIRTVLENDACEVNKPDPILGWTPLYKAVLYRDFRITQILLENGADPNLCNQMGENALHIAIENGLDEVVELLIKYGVDLSICGKDGQTPIHLAILKKNLKIIKIILDSGVSLDCKNATGRTPLHLAIESENEEIIRILLDKKADFTIQDNCGISPLQMNMAANIKEIINSYCNQGENPLKEKNLNEIQLNSLDQSDTKIKQNLQQKFNNIQEKIENIEQNNKTELNNLDSEIENTLKQFSSTKSQRISQQTPENPDKKPEDQPISLNISKKSSINFEEYKEKHLTKITETSIETANINKSPIKSSQSYKNHEFPLRNPQPNQPYSLKTSEHDATIPEKPIDIWLREIQLQCLLQNFLDLGVLSSNLLLKLLRQETENWDKMLITHLGIDKPGHRKRIITKLKEDLGLCRRSGLFKLKNSNAKLKFLDIGEWLKSLGLEELEPYFVAAGYDDYESLVFQMTTDQTINEKILEDDVLIEDPLARMKICNQLMEDALKAAEIEAPENFEGEISFEVNERKPGNWKETCTIF